MTASGLIDKDLADIFNSKPSENPKVTIKDPKMVRATAVQKVVSPEKPREKPVETTQQPVSTTANNVHTLARCAWIAIQHGAVEMVLFYWGLAEKMEYRTSFWACVIVAVICGFRIGWHFCKGAKQ